ncbi:hypothetical protein EAF04_007327 [Stromatinia cepivora]|nr:hypothetical protein EAF04_007327 [Stromatinia cepivora]
MEELLGEVLCCIHKRGGSHPQNEEVGRKWWEKVERVQRVIEEQVRAQAPLRMVQRERNQIPVAVLEPLAAAQDFLPLEINPVPLADRNRMLEGRFAQRRELIRRQDEFRIRDEERIREEERREREETARRERQERERQEREEEERREKARRLHQARLQAQNAAQQRQERDLQIQVLQQEAAARVQNIRNLRLRRLAIPGPVVIQPIFRRPAIPRLIVVQPIFRRPTILELVAVQPLFQPRPIQRPLLRKPLGDCPLCFEPIAQDEDAEWCRAQCGQNVCKGCFEQWRVSLLGRRQLTCCICRAVWKSEGE